MMDAEQLCILLNTAIDLVEDNREIDIQPRTELELGLSLALAAGVRWRLSHQKAPQISLVKK